MNVKRKPIPISKNQTVKFTSKSTIKRPSLIAYHLIHQIFSSDLKSGIRLPPERKLAEQQEIDRTSLQMTFFILERMNLISTRQDSGILVNDYEVQAGLDLLPAIFYSTRLLRRQLLYKLMQAPPKAYAKFQLMIIRKLRARREITPAFGGRSIPPGGVTRRLNTSMVSLSFCLARRAPRPPRCDVFISPRTLKIGAINPQDLEVTYRTYIGQLARVLRQALYLELCPQGKRPLQYE